MIHYFPLEASEQRWTGFMDRAIVDYLDRQEEKYIRYHPGLAYEATLEAPDFYNAVAVTEFRSIQLTQFAQEIRTGARADRNVVFFTDLLVPGVEAVGYMLHLSGLDNFEIRGLVHAGSFTEHDVMSPTDRIATSGAAGWGWFYENAVFELCKEVYLGSEWIRQDIINKRVVEPESKLVVTGFPLDPELDRVIVRRELRPISSGEQPIVVFTGRLSPDKQPWLFRQLATELHGQARFVVCLEAGLDKQAYYELLSRAKVVVSFALQETFGTGVQEAVKLGCIPVVPNRCCYPEQFDKAYRFDAFAEAVELVQAALDDRLSAPEPLDCSTAVERWFR